MELMHENIQIIDVRERNEMPELPELKALNIPIGQISNRENEIKKSGKTIVFCGSGKRSITAIKMLQDDFAFRNLINLKNGIQTYIEHRDSILSNNE
jgi:adenylyltransferase/sulfurtransferase